MIDYKKFDEALVAFDEALVACDDLREEFLLSDSTTLRVKRFKQRFKQRFMFMDRSLCELNGTLEELSNSFNKVCQSIPDLDSKFFDLSREFNEVCHSFVDANAAFTYGERRIDNCIASSEQDAIQFENKCHIIINNNVYDNLVSNKTEKLFSEFGTVCKTLSKLYPKFIEILLILEDGVSIEFSETLCMFGGSCKLFDNTVSILLNE